MDDSDDFGDDFGEDSGDLEIEHNDVPATKARAKPPSESGSLFGDGDDASLEIDHDNPPAPRPVVARAPHPSTRPSAPVTSRRGASAGDLFSDGDEDDGGLSLSAEDDGDIEVDHAPPADARRPAPPPANYTDPSMDLSLDANDAELAELLGDPQARAAPAARAPSLPRPAAQAALPLPQPPPAEPISLGAEDSELADLLNEHSGSGSGVRPLPPPPPPPAAPQLARKISFQEPPAAPAVLPPRGPAPAVRRPGPPSRDDDFADIQDDDDDDFGLTADVDREVEQIASQGSKQGQGRSSGMAGGRGGGQAFRSPAPDDSLGDDFGSELEDEASLDSRPLARGRAPPPPSRAPVGPSPGGSFRSAVRQQSSGAYSDDPYEDSFDSPGAHGGRPPPRGIQPRGLNRDSSEAGDDGYDDEYGDSMYDSREGVDGGGSGGGGAAFRRAAGVDTQRTPPTQRPQAPGPYDEDQYDDEYDDEDDFADDLSWDGEIRHTRGAYNAGGRPGSAGQPRSRGPHATGGRRRPLSALAPRERQAAMIEDMMSRHPSTWDIREVAAWVEFIGMGQYRAKFVHHSVDGTLLLSLGEPELARDLRILPLGHRRAMLGAIAELREAAEAAEKDRADRGLPPAAAQQAKTEAERLAQLRQLESQQEGQRRPSSAGAKVIPPEPYLGPAKGKMTVYEQRAKLLYQLDKARHRAAQHAAIIEQLANNKALTEQQMANLRGKLKDLEAKHKDVLSPAGRIPGMIAPVSPGSPSSGRRRGAAALAEAEYGADAAVPWLPVGRGTRPVNPHPERFARTGEDPTPDLTFRPRTLRVQDVPYGAVRDIVAKALSSRVPFWRRMDFEFEKMRKEREAREEARQKRRERMGLTRRGGGGDGEDEEQAKSKFWNNYWVPGSQKNSSYHKHFRRGSENEELRQYRSFAKDKTRLSRWFKRFVDDGESTEGDVALERLINRMIKALVKTKDQMDMEIGESFEKRIRRYFEERGYKFATHTSNTIMVRARGTRPPAPTRPDSTLYDFEEVEQYYPDYLKKKVQAAAGGDEGGGDDEEETRMVPKRTTWKRLVAMYYMDRQKKIKAAIAMVKMSQFVQRHGVRWPPERDREDGKKAVWVPNSNAGALHQVDGRDRTFNTVGQDNIGLQVKLKKALGPPQPVTFQMRMKQLEAVEAKADALFAAMGWPHSSGDPELGPPQEPLLLPEEDDEGGTGAGEDEFGLGGEGEGGFGLEADNDGGGRGGGRRPRQRRAPALDFHQALDALLGRGLELRHLHDEWLESLRRARERGYGEETLPHEPPRAEDLDWSGDPLMDLQQRAMERQRQQWLLQWEKARRLRERRVARLREQGYREEDIERRLGRQQEAEEVESHVRNELLYYVALLARLKPSDLTRFQAELKGTKKKMAVYRALCNQMFIDEARAKESAKEATMRSKYDSLRIGPAGKKMLSPAQEEAVVRRMEADVNKRQGTIKRLVKKHLEEEASSLTPWYVLHPPSRPASRAGSPGRASSPPDATPRCRSRSPRAAGASASAASTPRPRSAQRPARPASPGPGGPGTGDGSSRSKYVFGSSTPKSMWGPMGPVRRGTTGAAGGAGGGGTSLLDSPGLLGLQQSAAGATPTGPRAVSTPTRQRPLTPTRSSAGGANLTPDRGGAASPAPPQRPRSAAAAPPASPRPSVGGRGGGRPSPAAPPSPASRGRPPSPAGGRYPVGPPVGPRPRSGSAKVGFTAEAARPRPSAGGAGGPQPRRGLLDGDTTSGASASPSPQRAPDRPQAAGPNGAGGARLDSAQQRRGLADSESSPSPSPPRPRRPSEPPEQLGQTLAAASTSAASVPGAPQSRRSSQTSGTGIHGSRPGSVSGPGPAAPPAGGSSGSQTAAGTPQRRASSQSIPPAASPPGPSRQASASSSLGLPSGGGSGPAGGASGPTRGSRSGSGSGSGSGQAAAKRPSTPPSPLHPQPSGGELGTGPSQRSLQSQGSGGSSHGSGRGAGSGASQAAGDRGGSSGPATATRRSSPLSRSPASQSPQPAASPVGSTPQSPRAAGGLAAATTTTSGSGASERRPGLDDDGDAEGEYGDEGFDEDFSQLDLGDEEEF